MAYILTKQSTLNRVRRNLYYLVESYREGGKIKRRKILGLGESKGVDELIDRLQHKEREIKEEINEWEEKKKVVRHWKFQRQAEKWLEINKLKLEKLREQQRKILEARTTYKM